MRASNPPLSATSNAQSSATDANTPPASSVVKTSTAEPELSRENHLTKLLRDSAIILAAGTGLLYLTGHVYVDAYLDTLGIGGGFHGVGISNLALISWPFVVAILMLTGFIYYATTNPK